MEPCAHLPLVRVKRKPKSLNLFVLSAHVSKHDLMWHMLES